MKRAKVVIGAGWGDCGKGLLTDFYSSPETVVVRYCSGANAGHTVCRDGRRHVFHHLGSGTLRGASTYLSRFFITNPILYFRELATLNGLRPQVMADPAGLLTTPFDMMLNQMVEQARGSARHGSCGVGINETVKRAEAGYMTVVDDLNRLADLKDMLLTIRSEWVPARLQALGVPMTEQWQERLDSDGILDAYLDCCIAYRRQITMCPLAKCDGPVIFEGAQGLLLDEDHHFFPHVTHAHTGLTNVMPLARDAGITGLDVVYATRAYATRHGAGPFPREVPGLAYADATNVPNDWQGHLRFGHLDLDLLRETVQADLAKATIPVRHGVAVTCLDQVSETVSYWSRGIRQCSRGNLTRLAAEAVNAAFSLSSYGPSAAHIKVSTDNSITLGECVS